MKRYSMKFFEGHKSRASVVVPVECEDGEWISVADASALKARLKEAVVMLDEAHKHLEFCGYGDAYERDCARDDKLDQRITAILEANSELLEAQA